jgi:uncharacterized protein YukE
MTVEELQSRYCQIQQWLEEMPLGEYEGERGERFKAEQERIYNELNRRGATC